MNEKLEKLNQEIEETEKKLRWAQQEEKRQLMKKVFAGHGAEKEGAK